MHTEDNDSILVFSSGRRVRIGEGTIGIAPDGTGYVVTGYDDCMWDEQYLTPAERQELADTMIAAWTRWRDEEQP